MKNGGDVIGGFFSGGAENVPVPSQRARAEEVSSSEVFFATSLQQCRGVLTQYISFTTLSMPPLSRKRTAEQKRSNSPAHSDAPSEEEPSAVIDPPSSVHVTPLRQLASAGRKPAASTKQLQEAAEEEIARLQDRIAVVEASLAREKVPVTGKQQLYFQCAPVLYEGASRLPNEEAPEWYQTLLPVTQSTWNFPPFEPKNGTLETSSTKSTRTCGTRRPKSRETSASPTKVTLRSGNYCVNPSSIPCWSEELSRRSTTSLLSRKVPLSTKAPVICSTASNSLRRSSRTSLLIRSSEHLSSSLPACTQLREQRRMSLPSRTPPLGSIRSLGLGGRPRRSLLRRIKSTLAIN